MTESGSGGLHSNVATFTVNIAAVDDAPFAVTGVVTTTEGSPVSGTLQATDSDGGSVSFSIVSQPAQGTVTITDAATGAFTYTPNAGAIRLRPVHVHRRPRQRDAPATEMVFIVANSPRWPGQTVRASVASDGAEGTPPAIFADRRAPTGASSRSTRRRSNLVAGDTNGASMCSCTTARRADDARERGERRHARATTSALVPALSADGRYVAF